MSKPAVTMEDLWRNITPVDRRYRPDREDAIERLRRAFKPLREAVDAAKAAAESSHTTKESDMEEPCTTPLMHEESREEVLREIADAWVTPIHVSSPGSKALRPDEVIYRLRTAEVTAAEHSDDPYSDLKGKTRVTAYVETEHGEILRIERTATLDGSDDTEAIAGLRKDVGEMLAWGL